MLKMTLKSALAVAVITCSASLFAAEVTVSAAASLTNAFKDIAENFEAAHPEHKVLLNFAGSGELLQQIAKGAPVDVFCLGRPKRRWIRPKRKAYSMTAAAKILCRTA